MKILIRGAGDLATGIASRLYGAGHPDDGDPGAADGAQDRGLFPGGL